MFEKEEEKKRICSNKEKSETKLVRNKKGLGKSSFKDKFMLKEVAPSKEKPKNEIEENRGNDTSQLKKENSIDWCESSRKWLEKKFTKLIGVGKQKKNFSRIACPPKQKNNTSNINKNEIIDANWTKDKVINFLKTKLEISQEILAKINDEEIDGESFVLLRDDDYKTLGIGAIKKNKILPHVDKDILRLGNNIKQDPIYIRVEKENKDNLWNSLDEKLNGLKLGEVLKYIKYLIIRDMPPNKEETEDLYIYFQKVLDLKEEILIEIKENIDDLLYLNEKDLQQQCEEWKLGGYDEFKLKIIFEIIRQKKEEVEEKKDEKLEEKEEEKKKEKEEEEGKGKEEEKQNNEEKMKGKEEEKKEEKVGEKKEEKVEEKKDEKVEEKEKEKENNEEKRKEEEKEKVKMEEKEIVKEEEKSGEKESEKNENKNEDKKEEKEEDQKEKKEEIRVEDKKEEKEGIKEELNEEEKKEEINEEKKKEKNEEKKEEKEEEKNEEKNGINENIQREENSTSSIKKENNIDDEDEYLFYCVIEVFEYQTSQRDITLGLRNPKDEYQRICMDFNIKYEEETSYLDYNEANKYELSTFMLWGSKESLFSFFKFHKITIAIDSLENKNNEKSGIYLCLNKNKKIAYLIIWPGKKSYAYSKIDEPNDSILLTLIRYGFYLSRNSILCLSNNEIEEFDYNGYEIFQDPESSAFLTERNQVIINENINKIFKIEETNHYIEGLKDIFKGKKIINAKINQNCILLSEELKDAIKTTKIEKKEFDEFILYESKFDLYFEEKFDILNIPINKFYLLIRQCPCYLKNKSNCKYYTEEQLKDIFQEKLNKEIDKLFNQINSELLNDNFFNRKYICHYCKDTKNTNELYYNKKKKYFHKSCYLNNNKNNSQFNFNELDEDAKEIEKNELYVICKNNILSKIGNKKNKKNELIIRLFSNCEKKFEIIENKNAWIIDKNILFEEIQNFKNLIFEHNYNNKEGNKKLIEKEYEEYRKFLNDKDRDAKCKEWKKNWKEKINKYFNESQKKIEKWIILKSYTKNKKNKSEFNYFFDYEYKEKYSQTTTVNLYEIMPYINTSSLNLRYSEYLGKENEIENYFYQENLDGIVIYKIEDNIMIKLNEVRDITFKGIYDYDFNSKILILFREEDGIKKTVLYLNNQISEPNFKIFKNLEINELLKEDSKVHNIKLIPCITGYENQSALFFIDDKIKLMKIKDGTQTGKFLDLPKFFNYKDLNEFQFIIYFDFLLILKYNEKNKE